MSDEKQTHDLPAVQGPRALGEVSPGSALEEFEKDVLPDYRTTIPADAPDARELAYQMLMTQCGPAEDIMGKDVELRHILFHVATITDEETGEVMKLPRTALLLTDGTIWEFFSKWGLKSLLALTLLHPTPWLEPITVRVTKRKSRDNAGAYFWVEKVNKAPQVNKKAKPS